MNADRTRDLRVGFVGLGSQGGPMARRIAAAGFPTTLWARRASTLEPFADSAATVASTLEALGESSDVLCICVTNDADVDEVLRGPSGALSAMANDSVVVVHSTVHPATCLQLQHDFPTLQFVDAPVSGGGAQAEAGELLVMAGGQPDAVTRCQPVFATYGDPVLHIGPLGAGQEAKLLNNAMFTAQIALAAEAYAIAASRGLDRGAVAAIFASGSGRSYAAEIVSSFDFDLTSLGAAAGPLLAKDIAILVEHAGLGDSALLAAADVALEHMNVRRTTTNKDKQ